ncbi:MAG: hypothetical protein WDN76_06650 [Alphaproteobacteria bacterium]
MTGKTEWAVMAKRTFSKGERVYVKAGRRLVDVERIMPHGSRASKNR